MNEGANMTQFLEIDGKRFEITGFAEDGLPILKAQVVATEEGFDEDGNPIRSVNINVPPANPLPTE